MPIEVTVAFFILMHLAATVLYLLMAFLPHAALTRRVMESLWSIAVPAIIHTAYIVLWIAYQPQALDQLRGLYAQSGVFGQAGIEFLARAIGTPAAVVAAWNHMVAGDMVVARWAYRSGRMQGIPTPLISLCVLLIGLFGPMGLVVYLAVRQIHE